MALIHTLERDAVLKGMAASIIVCLPMALVAQSIADRNDGGPSAWAFVLFVGVLLGFAFGGWIAARDVEDYPYTNGAVAALIGYVVIQGIAIIVRLVGNDPVHVATVVFNGLIAYGCGLTGALIGSRDSSP